MTLSDLVEATRQFVVRLAMVVVIAAGLLVLIVPLCRDGMSATSIAAASPTAAIDSPHGDASRAGCGVVLDGLGSCRAGAPTGRPGTALAPAVGSSLPGSDVPMLACITVLMVVLAAVARLQRPRLRGPAVPQICVATLVAGPVRGPSLAELRVLRT